ncbi:MAG: AI-2E family transporter [Thermoanaerobaculia bacterium]|jgi:predicted PurR-regulated permease PerM
MSAGTRDADSVTRKVRFEISLSTVLMLVVVLASLWLLIRLAPVLLVLVVALLVVGTMSPAVRWLEARRARRGLAIAFVFFLISVVAILVVTLSIPSLVQQAGALLEREPEFRAGLADRLDQFRVSASLANWLRHVSYDGPGSTIGATAFDYSIRLFTFAAYGLSAIFLALYIMIDRDRLRGGLFAVVPRSHHIRLSRVMLNLETIVGAYIRGQLTTSFLMGAFTFILLRSLGVENAMVLAMIAAVADVLPYVGVFVAVVPSVIATLARGPETAGIVLVVMIAYAEFEGRVLIPRIYGGALRLPSSVVFFALMVGGTLMGIVGGLLALPMAATIMMLIEELRVELPGEQEQVADTETRVRDDLAEQEYERRTEGGGAAAAAAIAVEMSADRKLDERHAADPKLRGRSE